MLPLHQRGLGDVRPVLEALSTDRCTIDSVRCNQFRIGMDHETKKCARVFEKRQASMSTSLSCVHVSQLI